ncbi:hypothetical protein D9619_009468 [Psilocybe cf. subviscida]|uniref:Fe2OG dioxygenase domain-containing protein n=1 Tax=Psilocybe cf. subviscida TaxID=2480587 RepID=A0A8H5BVX0_9AGAR|nr:hypothetical protein D9619_009468 [Psilocybe cf. subviscida]
MSSPARPSAVKAVDFGPFIAGSETERRVVAEQIIESFQQIGFVYLTNHGIPQHKIDAMFAWSRNLFGQPMEVKQLAPHPPSGAHHRGYSAPGREAVPKRTRNGDVLEKEVSPVQRDIKESFEAGREDDSVMPNIWFPDGVLPGFKEACLDFYWTCNDAKTLILSALALGLKLPDDYFIPSHSKADNQLRLLHYPSIPAETLADKDASRIPSHSDYGCITLLMQDDVGGLEVEDPNMPGTFLPVPPIPGSIVVNAADFLSRWSNDTIKSTVHRVRAPTSASGTQIPDRYSIPYFCSPDFNTVVDCIPSTWSEDRPKKYIPTSSCRRTLARNMILDGKSRRDYDEVFSFLVRTDLVTCIRNLFVQRFDPGKLASGVPLAEMLNLRRIKIVGAHFFSTADFQQGVVRQLENCHNLRELEYINLDIRVTLPHDELPILGLQTLRWCDNGNLRPAFFSLCAASFSTLICLRVRTEMPISEHGQYLQLFNIRFPHLEVFEIGPGSYSISGPVPPGLVVICQQLAQGFSRFLIAHSTIKALTLKHNDDVSQEAYILFDENLLSSTVLPNLESLKAYPSQITQFISVKANFFRTLLSLSIRESMQGDMERVLQVMFRKLQELKDSVGPLGLRHLVLAFNDNRHDCRQLCKRWLDTCADVFPLLETYTGETFRSPTMFNEFPHFQHLRLISCAVRHKKWRSQHAQAIGENCPSLEKIESFRRKRIFDVIQEFSLGKLTVRTSSRDGEDIDTEDEFSFYDDFSDDASNDSDAEWDLIGTDSEDDDTGDLE